MNALSGEELLAWVDTTSDMWKALLEEHPEALALPCDVMGVGSVAKLLQHIVAVELRYAQRLAGLAQSPYEEIPHGSAEEIFRTHVRAAAMLREIMARPEIDWDEWIVFETRSMGTMRASRRTILVHALIHAVRHYAQLATLVRQHGIAPGWQMDYLTMGAEPV